MSLVYANQSQTWKGLDLQAFGKLTQYRVEAHTGVRYPCTQRDIDAYSSFDPAVRCIWNGIRGGYMSDEASTRRLTAFLEPNMILPDNIAAALSRCRDATRGNSWGPETITKALPDLDTALFDGHLRGLITVRWVTLDNVDRSEIGKRMTRIGALGMTCYEGKRRSIIYLNAVAFFAESADPEGMMWRVMIHELLHCYIIATTGDSDPDEWDECRGWTDYHGWQFRWLISLIDTRVARYMGLSRPIGAFHYEHCLLCAAESGLVPKSIADDFIRGGRQHEYFCPHLVERGNRSRR